MRPNILYIHSHDTGRYIQPYGYPVATPHLQRFAEQGVVFRQAFCASPTCSPSRAALLTGQYPHCAGMHGLASPPWGYVLRDYRKYLAHYLNDLGYLTVLGGVQHLAKAPVSEVRDLGYERFLNEDNIGEDVADLHERAAAFLGEAQEKPWYLALGFDETHRDSRPGQRDSGTRFSKYHAYDPAQLDARYVRPPAIFPDLPETRADWASYQVGVAQLDARIGRVLAALEASGQAERTLVIVTTDHGLAWPGMKCNLTDHGLGVMLMLRGPGGFTDGRVIDEMVTHMDLFPTLCEVLASPPAPWLQGRSLLPLIREEGGPLHDAIFAEQGWHEIAEPQRAVRTNRFKYIRRFDPVGPKETNCDEGPTKRLLLDAGWFDRLLGDELLFDLILDPQERNNLVRDPGAALVAGEMRARLRSWMEATQDPLLQGKPVAPPVWIRSGRA